MNTTIAHNPYFIQKYYATSKPWPRTIQIAITSCLESLGHVKYYADASSQNCRVIESTSMTRVKLWAHMSIFFIVKQEHARVH